jgi:hypothetical protein
VESSCERGNEPAGSIKCLPSGCAAKKYLVFLCSVRRLLVAASVVPSSPILVTLMKETLG